MPKEKGTSKGQGRHFEQGVKLLVLRDYLCSHSSPKHKVSMEQILNHLAANDIPCERKAIYADLDRLRRLKYDIVLDKSGDKIGYYVSNPTFNYDDIRILIDGVQSLKFVPQKRAEELTNKLKQFTDAEGRNSLSRTSFVADRAKSMNESAIEGADKIHHAIMNNRKISFKYAHYWPDHQDGVKYSRKGDKYIVSPYALVWSGGNQYLYAYITETQKFRTFRVDRMYAVADPLLEARDGVELYKKNDIVRQEAKVFDMFRGEPHKVSLRVRKNLFDAVVDKFGKDVLYRPIVGDDEHIIVNVNVELSPPFYAWVFTFGARMKIVGDEKAVADMKKYVKRLYELYEDDSKK